MRLQHPLLLRRRKQTLFLLSLQRDGLMCGSIFFVGRGSPGALLITNLFFYSFPFLLTSHKCLPAFRSSSAGRFLRFFFLYLLRNGFRRLWLELSYMIIGLTSLCLYSNINFLQLQYGILYKIISLNLCKTQKFLLLGEKPLTPPESLCYTKYVGRPLGRFIALDS